MAMRLVAILNELDKIVHAYQVCALWSSTDDDEDCTPLDKNYGVEDIAPESTLQMIQDVADFVRANYTDYKLYVETMARQLENWDSAIEYFGHDFWLTRNGHGAGFWDRGLKDLGDRLSNAAEVYGSVYLYVGDDGEIYSN